MTKKKAVAKEAPPAEKAVEVGGSYALTADPGTTVTLIATRGELALVAINVQSNLQNETQMAAIRWTLTSSLR